MLSGVSDVFNAIMVRGDEVGDVMFYGRGAGKFPTASAVVGDVIDCAKHLVARKYLNWDDGEADYVLSSDNDIARFYVRLKTDDVDKTVKEIERKFSNPSYIVNADKGEVAMLTENDIEITLKNQIGSLDSCEVIKTFHVID